MTVKHKSALLARQQAVSACVKRFVGQPLNWGRTDCVKLCALALRKQGHPVPLLKGVRYSSEQTALRRFREQGLSSLCDAVDALGLVKIAPAMAMPGDLIALPTPEGDAFKASLMVVHTAAARRVIGLDGQGAFAVLVPNLELTLACWRTPETRKG